MSIFSRSLRSVIRISTLSPFSYPPLLNPAQATGCHDYSISKTAWWLFLTDIQCDITRRSQIGSCKHVACTPAHHNDAAYVHTCAVNITSRRISDVRWKNSGIVSSADEAFSAMQYDYSSRQLISRGLLGITTFCLGDKFHLYNCLACLCRITDNVFVDCCGLLTDRGLLMW